MSRTKVTREALVELYINDLDATHESVAKKLDASRAAVIKGMKRYGLESRNTAGKPRVEIPELSDSSWLKQKFIEEAMSATNIGKLLGCSQTTILNTLKEHGIDTQRALNPMLQDKAWLEQEYVDHMRTLESIGIEAGTTKHSVRRALKSFGIERRKSTSKYSQLNDKEWLHRAYLDEKLSIKQIANLIGSTEGNVHSALTHSGIETRGYKEGPAIRFPEGRWGKDSANWKNGITKLNHAIRSSNQYREWRDEVYKRDDYTCQGEDCGKRNGNGYAVILEADHKEPLAILIMKHNIADLREALMCKELWDVNNGVTLCKECHRRTVTWGRRGYDRLSEEEKMIVSEYVERQRIDS